MEYAETAAPRPLEDGHDLFRRVWARVMPEDRVDCPFLVLPVPEPEDVPPDAKAALPALPPAPEGPAPLCLGPACAPCLPLLRELAAGKLDLARAYRSMARQAGGGTGRTLSALAGDEERHARRLAAAAFLISGERRALSPHSARSGKPCSLSLALRRAFQEEQRAGLVFRTAREELSDPALRQLMEDIAREDAGHVRTVLALVEEL